MIVEKEIPRLSKILVESNAIAKPLTVTLRKGKEHYFCKRRFYDFYDKIKLYPESTADWWKPSMLAALQTEPLTWIPSKCGNP